MNFAPIDYIFTIIILIFAVVALIKGFIQEFFGKAALILGILCGIIFYPYLLPLLNKSINVAILCKVLAFLIVFIVVFIVLKLIGSLISRLCEFSILKGLDRGLGFALGAFEGLVIVTFIIFLLGLQTIINTDSWFSNSFYFVHIGNLLNKPEVQDAIRNV